MWEGPCGSPFIASALMRSTVYYLSNHTTHQTNWNFVDLRHTIYLLPQVHLKFPATYKKVRGTCMEEKHVRRTMWESFHCNSALMRSTVYYLSNDTTHHTNWNFIKLRHTIYLLPQLHLKFPTTYIKVRGTCMEEKHVRVTMWESFYCMCLHMTNANY
jgi:hypothetical protein